MTIRELRNILAVGTNIDLKCRVKTDREFKTESKVVEKHIEVDVPLVKTSARNFELDLYDCSQIIVIRADEEGVLTVII